MVLGKRAWNVLVVTTAHDVHVDPVRVEVERRGGRVFPLELDRFPRDYDIEVLVNGAWSARLTDKIRGEALDLSSVSATWLRKRAPFAHPTRELGPQELAFANDEAEHVLLGILNSLDCFWMSDPAAIRRANWKPEQLKRAVKFGFSTPATILTNVPDSVRRFHESNPKIIYKPLSGPDLGADSVLPSERVARPLLTTILDDGAIAMIDGVSEVPCLFQALVQKQYEIRVTVVGSDVFAARIDSTSPDKLTSDWRDPTGETRYSFCELPPEIAERCRAFVWSYGLVYGAIDLMVDKEGAYIFLENNPQGQYLFVEERVPELKISDAVASLLAQDRS